MIVYILKLIVISAVLIFVYRTLLEMEKIHQFKRAYLLTSVVLSITIPFIPIKIAQPNPTNSMVLPDWFQAVGQVNHSLSIETVPANENDLMLLLSIFYFFIVIMRLMPGLRHWNTLWDFRRRGEIIPYNGVQLVMIPEPIMPYSFMNSIYLNRQDYLQQRLPEEVLYHEFTHVNQKHMFDLIFIELVKILIWFNPCWFWYKTSIQLNHEFIADDAVLRLFNNPTAYKKLIFESVKRSNQHTLTSPFNFITTKKRLIMLSKSNLNPFVWVKQLLLIPVFLGLVLIAGKRLYGQVPDSQIIKENKATTGVSQELFDEYQKDTEGRVMRFKMKNGKMAMQENLGGLSNPDIVRLRNIFVAMSDEQKTKANKIMYLNHEPPSIPIKKPPTPKQLTDWQDSKVYGVWLDGKRIANDKLGDVFPSDIVLFYISKLEKNAYYYGEHFYQINLLTPTYFDKLFVQSGLYK